MRDQMLQVSNMARPRPWSRALPGPGRGAHLFVTVLCLLLFQQTIANAKADKTTPWSLPQFQSVLAGSSLQAPRNLAASHDLVDFANKYFFAKDKYVCFQVSGSLRRSELRQREEWKTNTQTRRRMTGQVWLDKPPSKVARFTFYQIHGGSKPLLRLAWYRKRLGKSDYIVAVFRYGLKSTDLRSIDLVRRPKGRPFSAEITVHKNNLKVLIDEKEVMSQDVSHWGNFSNFFKAGVYIQKGSQATTVKFKSLNFYNDDMDKKNNNKNKKKEEQSGADDDGDDDDDGNNDEDDDKDGDDDDDHDDDDSGDKEEEQLEKDDDNDDDKS